MAVKGVIVAVKWALLSAREFFDPNIRSTTKRSFCQSVTMNAVQFLVLGSGTVWVVMAIMELCDHRMKVLDH